MSYPGSKGQAGTFHRIIGQMPPHSVYVEPFFGSGKVFWSKARAAASVVIDRDGSCLEPVSGLNGVHPICGDALSELPKLTLAADSVVYCDPPYLLSTRKDRRYYNHEMTDQDHESLLALLQGLNCAVMISGYPSMLYAAALHEWRCITYRTRTRGRTVMECLWCNFPEPSMVHDPRYAGQSHRERVTFKRLAARWLARLESMPPRKRSFVLGAIARRHFPDGRAGLQRQS